MNTDNLALAGWFSMIVKVNVPLGPMELVENK
jgi:hypothetical protein